MCSTDWPADVFSESICVARKVYRCDECGSPIRAGSRYNRIGMLFEGSWSTMRVHWECRVLWGAVQLDLCGGHGLIEIGGLDNELDEADFAEARPYRDRFQAIREKYAAGALPLREGTVGKEPKSDPIAHQSTGTDSNERTEP